MVADSGVFILICLRGGEGRKEEEEGGGGGFIKGFTKKIFYEDIGVKE